MPGTFESRAIKRNDALLYGKIVPNLAPHSVHSGGEPIPGDIIGARILDFGTIAWEELEGVVLVIEYAPGDGSAPRRVGLEFTELGMWVEGSCESANQPTL